MTDEDRTDRALYVKDGLDPEAMREVGGETANLDKGMKWTHLAETPRKAQKATGTRS